MSAESIRIERIKLKDLPSLAAAAVESAAPGAFIPITKQRAVAHISNPNADPDDIALLLAREGQRYVGYFGVMPVMLQHDGRLHKVHWLTTWAVAPGYLGKGLGSKLMEAALALNVDLGIVGSQPARRVAAKFGFKEVERMEYVQIDLGLVGRYNPISLLLRFVRKVLSFFKIKLNIESLDNASAKVFDLIFSPLLRPVLLSKLRAATKGVGSTVRTERMGEVQELDADQPTSTGFFRSIDVVNWMLSRPWVLTPGFSESQNLDYGFTDVRQGFAISGWQIFSSSGENQGFICFQHSRIRGRLVLKVLDYQFTTAAPKGMLLALAVEQAARVRADVIEGPLELAQPLADSWLARLLLRRKQRILQVHPRAEDSPLGKAWRQLQQSYVDGDMAFT